MGGERKEWLGPKWEYLVLSSEKASLIELTVELRGLYGKSDTPAQNEYSSRIEELSKEKPNASIADVINMLGEHGWEMVSTVKSLEYSGIHGSFQEKAFLFFKRQKQ